MLSPIQTIRTYLFGGAPRSPLAVPLSEDQRQQRQTLGEQPKSMTNGPQHSAPQAVPPRRLPQEFVITEPEAMLGNVPRFDRFCFDAAEYYCFVRMQLTQPDAIMDVTEELERVMSVLGPIHNYGRLTCRLLITALCHDIWSLGPTTSEDSVSKSMLDLSSTQWNDLKERFVLIRSLLISKGADLLVLPGVEGKKLPPNNTEVDPDQEHLAMFDEYFLDVLQKFLVQIAIVEFQERLPDEAPNKHGHAALLKMIVSAVDKYKQTLSDDIFRDADVPTTLTSFVLQDLYQSNREDIALLPGKLRQDINKFLLDETQPHSFPVLQVEVLNLLRRWHSTLTTPEFVRLGYGGIQDVPVEDDNRSVSSWGADETLNVNKELLSQQLSVKHQEEPSEDGDDDHQRSISVTTSVEPLPRDRFDEDALVKLPEQHVKQLEDAIEAEGGDDGEPILEREGDDIPVGATQESCEVASVTPLRLGNHKRKASMKNGDKLPTKRSRSVPLRFDGFTSSEDEQEDDEQEEEKLRISSRRKKRDIRSPSRQRMFFTEDETQAIIDGVKRFGPGNWTTIKLTSNGRLQNRTTVQIKDKYRTMIQRGEL